MPCSAPAVDDGCQHDVEALARPDTRAHLPLARLVRLYLDPFALFKNVNVGPPRARAAALEYNRRQRKILLAYLRRWTIIALACLASAVPLGAAARGEPALGVPFLGLELGFSAAVCVLLVSAAVYFLLGVED